jgi:hypothetical protein
MICKRNKCYVLIIIFTVFLVDSVEAQLTDLARLEYLLYLVVNQTINIPD